MTDTTQRLRVLAKALGTPLPDAPRAQLPALIAEAAGTPRNHLSYLVLSVILGEIPDSDFVKTFTRRWRRDGLEPLIVSTVRRARRRRTPNLPVRVVTGTVVDLTDTVASSFTTGIQRVAKETLALWWADRDLTLVHWTTSGRTLVSLTPSQIARVIAEPGTRARDAIAEIVVPFEAALVLPEIAVRTTRASRLRTIARHGGGRATAIGFDCIPITSSETTGEGMPGAFSKYLSALARFDAVAPISDASATEYRGWRRMLSGAGMVGPSIETVTLPFTGTGSSDPARAEKLREELALGDVPVVLCVGSHEPRKNHLGLLHACELAWRQGAEFTLVLVGGNSWDTDRFDALVDQLRRRDRRIVMLSGVDDDVIWDLYDLAAFSVFCSLNEGFGLPVAESLSHGTPVITSDFGSMRSLGEGNGAKLVDPRDAAALATAIIQLLTDPEERARLTAQMRSLPGSSWASYSSELWDVVSGHGA